MGGGTLNPSVPGLLSARARNRAGPRLDGERDRRLMWGQRTALQGPAPGYVSERSRRRIAR
jgi:hypothetical protein